MQLNMYQIDAFANKPFEGNPAAVIPLTEWLPDDVMQAVAEENNLSETVFFVPQGEGFYIRWFTPKVEIKLCGHATLASAYVLFNILGFEKPQIDFDSKSGILSVVKDGEWLRMNFPAQPPKPCEVPSKMIEAFKESPSECLRYSDYYVVIFDNEEQVIDAEPDFNLIKKLDAVGVIISSKSNEFDFIARFFAPAAGILEDPVTGSAYTRLIPYWAKRLNKTKMHAKQVSLRGGEVMCELNGERVSISGKAVKFFEGVIEIDI